MFLTSEGKQILIPFLVVFCYFDFRFLRWGLCIAVLLVWNSCLQGWPWTQGACLSASPVLWLKSWAPTPDKIKMLSGTTVSVTMFHWIVYNLISYRFFFLDLLNGLHYTSTIGCLSNMLSTRLWISFPLPFNNWLEVVLSCIHPAVEYLSLTQF